MSPPYDVAIVGAGPAGSAAARLLASWHHRVVLLHRAGGPASLLAESLPPSSQRVLSACGLLDIVDGAGFYRSTGNTVCWGAAEPRVERFESAPGYQVSRSRFDGLLRGAAVAAGAELRPALVRDVDERGDEVTVRLDGSALLRARFVLDCSGRTGVVARRGWRRAIDGYPRTVALAGVWTNPRGWRSVDPTHTVVESYEDGWAWSVPSSGDTRYVATMVDPQRTQLARGTAAAAVYAAEIAKTRMMASLAAGSTLASAPFGCDASVYAAHTYARDRVLLVGDAASFVDPLSSFGVKKALASAWLAAVAVNTGLRTPAMAAAALAFFAAREQEMASALLRQSRQQFEDAAAGHVTAFWTDRAAGVDAEVPHEPDVRALREDPRVRAAFAWLRAQPSIALREADGVTRAPQPVVRGREIVLEERIASAACPSGLRFVRDVDLAALVTLASSVDQVPALFEAYNLRCPPVALADFLGALSVLVAFGFLEDSRASVG